MEIAIIAHDGKKQIWFSFLIKTYVLQTREKLVATGTTGSKAA
jgi:methylglyoxal synthase